MESHHISTAHLDYLQRAGINLSGRIVPGSSTSAAPGRRRLWRVTDVGRIEKRPSAKNEHVEQRPASSHERQVRMPSEDMLTALYGYKIPLAFLVQGDASGVAVHLGVWAKDGPQAASTNMLNHGQEILKASLDSLYPAVPIELYGNWYGGIVHTKRVFNRSRNYEVKAV